MFLGQHTALHRFILHHLQQVADKTTLSWALRWNLLAVQSLSVILLIPCGEKNKKPHQQNKQNNKKSPTPASSESMLVFCELYKYTVLVGYFSFLSLLPLSQLTVFSSRLVLDCKISGDHGRR